MRDSSVRSNNQNEDRKVRFLTRRNGPLCCEIRYGRNEGFHALLKPEGLFVHSCIKANANLREASERLGALFVHFPDGSCALKVLF